MNNKQKLPEHIQKILDSGNLPDQRRAETSKYINFFLTYKCDAGAILDPMIAEITAEIEQYEWELPTPEDNRPPRKNRRAHVPNRRFRYAVRSIILNVLQLSEIRNHDVYLAVSLDANTYRGTDRYSPHDMGYDPFIDAYKGLERLGYIEVKHKGYCDPYEGGGLCTRIAASDLLKSMYDDAKDGRHINYIIRKITDRDKDELIILKGEKPNTDGIIGKLQYTDDKFTIQARRNLKRINRVIAKHSIKLECDKETYRKLLEALKGKKIDDPEQVDYIDDSAVRLYRIFAEGRFDRGGRFYRGWWQQVPKDYRQHITIDGQPTVEFDYSRFHISMAYALLGLSLSQDPYKNVHPAIDEDIAKYAINAMLNAKGIVKKHPDFNASTCGMTWEKLIKLLEEIHSPLVQNNMWGTWYGLTLQLLDSRLAEKIMLHFVKQDVVCLPIHDSFIVPENHKDELKELMTELYKKEFGQSIKVKQLKTDIYQ
ncbi:MAG: hypothetical protein LRY36_00295 [Alphaproteobacteria bacterium]|nr:hypothetical protein [Alphaproteobacteria bacterium]